MADFSLAIPILANHRQVDFTASPPKMLPVKPKVYLLCNVVIPAGCAADLCA